MAAPTAHNGSYKAFFDGLLKGTIKAETLHGDGGSLWYVDPEAPDVVAVGGIYETLSPVNPGLPTAAGGLGYGVWARIAPGRVLLGVADGVPGQDAAGLTLGAAQATPAGTVAAPVFTGTPNVATSAITAGTPTGTNSTPTMSGSVAAITAGTPAGTIGALTTAADSTTTGGTAKAIGQTPTFTGSAMGTHLHGVGTLAASAPTFTGSPLAAHGHTLTPTGTNSTPAFTGAALSVMQPALTVFIWTRTA